MTPPQLAASFTTANEATRQRVFLARQMVFNVIGDLLADRRQRKQFSFDERIVELLDKFPTLDLLMP